MTDLERIFRQKCKLLADLDEVPDDLWEIFNDVIRPLSNADKVFQLDMMSDIIHSWMMRQMVRNGNHLVETVRESVGNSIGKYALIAGISVLLTSLAFLLALIFNKPDVFLKTPEGAQIKILRSKNELSSALEFINSPAGKLAMSYKPETLRSILLCNIKGWKIEYRDGSPVCIPETGFRMPKNLKRLF